MTENIILKAGDVSSFQKLANFECRKEMDLAISSWLYQNKHELTLTEEALVEKVRQLAFKFKGVSWFFHKTLADLLEVSVKTVQRGLKKVTTLGLFTVYETRTSIKQKTAKGKGNPKGRGHNVYVINAIEKIDFKTLEKKPQNLSVQSSVQSVVSSRSYSENAVTPTPKQAKTEVDTRTSYSKPLFIKSLNIRKEARYSNNSNQQSFSKKADHTYTADYVPVSFRDIVKRGYDDALKIEAFWKKVLMAGKVFGKSDTAALEAIGVESFKALHKGHKNVNQDIMGYFFGILKKKMTAEPIENEVSTEKGYMIKTTYEGKTPDWFKKSREKKKQAPVQNDDFDIDAERQKLLLELGIN